MENKSVRNEPVSFSVIEEQARVDKKVVEKGKVKLQKEMDHTDQTVRDEIRRSDVDVENVDNEIDQP